MIQNLKVDIIYHQTPSDFEMEFNLCGCCRMRLLNDKTNDKKGFVRALARSVSRSRVIMACGPLFGTDGLINIVSIAIGSGLATCDNATYGISGDEPIQIISGSTPLVTPSGYFGGCIIESGPQTIVLLTENRTFRKEIMHNLIHPYLEEISHISTSDFAENIAGEPKEEIVQLTETESYIAEVDTDYSEEIFSESDPVPMLSQQDEHNIEFVMDYDAPAEEDAPKTQAEISSHSGFDNLYVEIEKPADIKARYEKIYTPSEADNMFISTVEPSAEVQTAKQQTKKRNLDVTIVVLVLVLLLALLTLVYFLVLKPITMGISPGEYIKEIFGSASSTLV